MFKTLALAAVLAAGTISATHAEIVKPIQAVAIDLGPTHGSAYYTADKAGYHLVATLDTGSNAPLRFVATLAKGQATSLSIPGALGENAAVITFVRTADTLEVLQAPLPFDAVTASTK